MSIFNVKPRNAAPEEQGLLTTALNVWNVPGSSLRGGIKEAARGGSFLEGAKKGWTTQDKDQVSTSDILEEQGMLNDNPYLQGAAGFAGDVILDPLNLIPGKWIGNVIGGTVRGAAKLTGAAKLAKKLGQTGVAQDLAKKVIPHFETPKALPLTGEAIDLRSQRSLLGMRQGGAAQQAQEGVYDALKHIPEEDLKELGWVMEGRPARNAAQAEAADIARKLRDDMFAAETAAGVMDPAKKVEDYITYLLPKGKTGEEVWYRSVSGKSRFSLPRDLKNWDEALEAGAEPNVLKALQVRAAVGAKAAATANWVDDIATKFGSATAIAPDWKKVSVPGIVETSPLGQKLANTFFPPEVADDLMRVQRFTDEGSGAISTMLQKITSKWKLFTTSANPAHNIRNAISNGWLMAASGLDPVTEVTPALIRGATQKGIAPSTMEAAKKFGIFSGGHYGEMQENAARTVAGSVLQKLNPERYAQFMRRNVANPIENAARLGMFDAFVRKGLSYEAAAMKVRNYLFQYDELTDFEKGIRRNLIPFYTWMRKAGPVVAESFITNPKLWARTNALSTALETASKGTGAFEGQREPWEAENLQFPVSGGATMSMPNPFPVTEINRLPGAIPGEDKQRWAQRTASMLTPLAKIPIETLLLNKSLYTGFPIVKDPTFGTPENEATMTTPQTAYSGLGKLAGKAMGYGEDKKGRQQAPAWVDYTAQQIPFLGPSVISPATSASEGGPGAAIADLVGANYRTPEQRKEKQDRLRNKARAQAKAKKRADKSLHRLDRLAQQAGAK